MELEISCSGGDQQEIDEEKQNLVPRKHGLSLVAAMFFIMGELAGSGLLALPSAISDTGWAGVAILILFGVNAGYTGILLGQSWMILEERWPEYKRNIGNPYGAIGERAVGGWARYLVSFCGHFTLLGGASVYLLLSSQIVHDFAQKFGISICYWVLIVALVLWPLMMFGTPSEFWWVGIIALFSTLTAAVLLLVMIVQDDLDINRNRIPPSEPNFVSFFLAFGTMAFSFGGASTFPTFQNDMRKRDQFPKAVLLGFIGLLAMYLPVAIGGYAVYGRGQLANIIDTVNRMQPNRPLVLAVEVLIGIHLFFGFLIIVNTPAQEIEEYLNIPKKFNFKRFINRTLILLLIVFVSESIPNFSKILNLVGASTSNLLTYVLPPWFYIALCRQKNEGNWPKREIPLHLKVYMIEIVVVGIVVGVTSSYTAMYSIITGGAFTPPCYVNMTLVDKNSHI